LKNGSSKFAAVFYYSNLLSNQPTTNNNINLFAGLRPTTLVVVVGLINNCCKLETYAKMTGKPSFKIQGAIHELPLRFVLLRKSYKNKKSI